MAVSIIEKLGLQSTPALPSLNTRTLLDIAVGSFMLGMDLKYILNGGISPMTAIVGRPGTYKSTTADSLIALLLKIYPAIEVIKYDTENNAFGVHRMSQISGIPTSELIKQFVLKNRTELNLIEFDDMLKTICDDRDTNRKDYLVETPFLDDSGNILKILIPLIVDIDSFSNAESVKNEKSQTDEKVSVEDSSHNMDYMFDGAVKTRLISKYANWSHKYGIYFIFTAHVADQFNLDPYNPSPKQHQFMKNMDKIKRCGAQFGFLTNLMLQMMTSTNIKTKVGNKEYECTYPENNATIDTDLSVIPTRIIRCKTNAAGVEVPLVISQSQGILPDLTNYHYLKTSKWGLIGNDRSPRSPFHPEINLERKKVREQLNSNYELCRGIEILAQLLFMKLNWTNHEYVIPNTVDEIVDKLQKSKTLKMNDILNSRGYWTYGPEKDTRPYFSIIDIMNTLKK